MSNNIMDLLTRLMQLGSHLPIHPDDQDKFFLFACLTLDLIWKIKNRLVFEGPSFILEDSVKVLSCKWNEFAESTEGCMPDRSRVAPAIIGWTKPLVGTIKLNTPLSVMVWQR